MVKMKLEIRTELAVRANGETYVRWEVGQG